jgi:hypothetical protein
MLGIKQDGDTNAVKSRNTKLTSEARETYTGLGNLKGEDYAEN